MQDTILGTQTLQIVTPGLQTVGVVTMPLTPAATVSGRSADGTIAFSKSAFANAVNCPVRVHYYGQTAEVEKTPAGNSHLVAKGLRLPGLSPLAPNEPIQVEIRTTNADGSSFHFLILVK